ncbi:putative Cytochrome c oxidase assembly factor 4 like protein [Fusarium oxysporum f. sp. albedinis]|nr:putative Cytochrome c oxidase assembly factor 4 like protein [Fusarium oxysporum f. sp. albedinis]
MKCGRLRDVQCRPSHTEPFRAKGQTRLASASPQSQTYNVAKLRRHILSLTRENAYLLGGLALRQHQ